MSGDNKTLSTQSTQSKNVFKNCHIILAQYFYNIKNGLSNITSKSSLKNLSNREVFPENWHFDSCFVLKTTKTPLFVFITEIL